MKQENAELKQNQEDKPLDKNTEMRIQELSIENNSLKEEINQLRKLCLEVQIADKNGERARVSLLEAKSKITQLEMKLEASEVLILNLKTHESQYLAELNAISK